MLFLSRINACPCTATSAYAWVPPQCTSAHPSCFCAASGLTQKKSPSRETPSPGRKCSHAHLQTVWVDVSSTWAHPNPPSTLGCDASSEDSHNKRLSREIPGEHFSIILSGSIVCLPCIYENRSLEIFIKVQEDAKTLLLVKLLQSDKMKPFPGMWPRREAHQERETMHV